MGLQSIQTHNPEGHVIYELNKPDYEKARPLFHPLAWHLTSAAVLDGNNPGRVFVDDPAWSRTFPLVFPDGDAGEAKKEALLAIYNRFAEETKSWERV